ncbi:MAG: hypothetical protein PF569_05985 [Candidatus Woesearchaeota archaeon]|jgi:hypothetical protein|nr:hypothetical protein [Candidatus Woesearchaeota archaeon]
MASIIFYDLDGVHVDWEGRAIEILGLDKSEIMPQLKSGKKLEDIHSDIYDRIENSGTDFWTGLELYPWAKELIELGKKYGEVAFLSSGGNIHKRTNAVADANAGKTRYVAKNFPGIPLVLTREKYLCASPNAILIDDTQEKIDKFREYGGIGFEFPHPYKIIEGDLKLNEVLGQLEKSLSNM